MSPGRIAVISLAAVAVIVALLAGGRGGDEPGGGPGTSGTGAAPAAPPSGALVVDFVYSPEKEPLVAAQIKAFNAQRTQAGGRTVFVKGEVVSSGDASGASPRER